MNRASSRVAGVRTLKPGDVGVPAFEAVRMLRRQLPAGAGGHADDERHVELAARHVADRRRIVDDLVERQAG